MTWDLLKGCSSVLSWNGILSQTLPLGAPCGAFAAVVETGLGLVGDEWPSSEVHESFQHRNNKAS